MSTETPFVIVGAGRIGRAIATRLEALELPVALVTRDAGWEAVYDGPLGDPILVCVRTDDLADVVARVPERRRADLVFIQNGAIRPLLQSLGVGGCTRGVLYFSADAHGHVAVGGDSPFCGPHAMSVARVLGAAGLSTRVVDWAMFTYFEAEKLLWLAVFGVLSEQHRQPVGVIADQRRDEVAALVTELLPMLRATYGIDPERAPTIDRLCLYASRIPTWSAAVREWPWRNGWFEQVAREFGRPTPLHQAALIAAGHADHLAS